MRPNRGSAASRGVQRRRVRPTLRLAAVCDPDRALHLAVAAPHLRPSLPFRFEGLKRELAAYIHEYNNDRVHHGRIAADVV
jgi:hypothetical protein